MKKVSMYVRMAFAFMMVMSSAAIAAEDMLPSEYYKESVLRRESGVYEHTGKLFVHSKAAIESKKNASKNKAMARATLGTAELLRKWAIEYTEDVRKGGEMLTDGEQYLKRLLDGIDDRWQFPDWTISTSMQCVKDGREADFYIVGLCGDKDAVVAAIPAEYRKPCDRSRLKEAVKNISRRFMSGPGARGFIRKCGAWDLADRKNVQAESFAEFEAVNADLDAYLRSSPLAEELREEVLEQSVPQVVTNVTRNTNPQGTMTVEKIEIVTTVRFPRMQKLFLNGQSETNFPTGRLPSGTAAIATIRNPEITVDEKADKFRQALCESPGDKDLWNFYGRILMKKGDLPGAVICFRNALKLDDRFVYPVVNLAVAYKMLGKEKLSSGLAVVASGIATDAWSISEIDKVLWNASDVSGRTSAAADTGKSRSPAKDEARKKSRQAEMAPQVMPKPKFRKKESSSKGFSSSEVADGLDF